MRARSSRSSTLALFVLELLLYGALVFAYLLLVVRHLGSWLKHLFDTNRAGYAVMALALIVTQGFVFELFTGALLHALRRRMR